MERISPSQGRWRNLWDEVEAGARVTNATPYGCLSFVCIAYYIRLRGGEHCFAGMPTSSGVPAEWAHII